VPGCRARSLHCSAICLLHTHSILSFHLHFMHATDTAYSHSHSVVRAHKAVGRAQPSLLSTSINSISYSFMVHFSVHPYNLSLKKYHRILLRLCVLSLPPSLLYY